MNDFTEMFSLKGKIAWVTGASYGIGFAIAKAYAAAGATIVFNDIRQELVDKGLAAYEAHPGKGPLPSSFMLIHKWPIHPVCPSSCMPWSVL